VFPRSSMLSPFFSYERKTFTVWMKSLVCHGNGCTVYDSSGEIVYRVENYGHKSSKEVYLMDLQGRVLVTLQRKPLIMILQRWYGFKCNGDIINKKKPWFEVKKCFRICMGRLICQVTVGFNKYRVVKLDQKAAFRIIDVDGDIVAEVKQKQSSQGIMLGNDVLTLIVEPNIDHSLVMAIVTVYGLMNHKM
ncbi:hypothetical protein Tsubulata_010279, partial [Turnera subulata]